VLARAVTHALVGLEPRRVGPELLALVAGIGGRGKTLAHLLGLV